jgi:hypothetical protein
MDFRDCSRTVCVSEVRKFCSCCRDWVICLEGVLLEVFDVVEKARCDEEWVSFVLEG